MLNLARPFLRPFQPLEWAAAFLFFWLLREWLLPLNALTDTGDLGEFLVLIAGVLLLDLLVQWRWFTAIIKLLGIFTLLYYNYFVTPFWELAWLKAVAARLSHDLPFLFQMHWTEMSLISRNLLFYILLAALVSLLAFLVLGHKQGLWFVFLEEAYLATLDTFMPYDADGSIMRTLVLGFMLIAVLHLQSMGKLAASSKSKSFRFWGALLAPLLIIAITVGLAYAGPKKAPSWPDPVAYFTKQQADNTVYMSKVGYDNNDEQLGGPFIQDNTPVFTAISNERTYWRGDSKDMYTGKGWQKAVSDREAILKPNEYTWTDQLFENMETKEVHATLDFHGEAKYSTIFYPGQLTKLDHYTPQHATILYDRISQSLDIRNGTEMYRIRSRELREQQRQQQVEKPSAVRLKLNNYRLTAEVPILSEKNMLEAGTDYPASIKQHYLQLPATLPPRVKQLAQQITQKAKTPYEKVQAVSTYLRNSGKYRYETKDVPIPEEGQDFVDQFLFESYRGYCDHFSTSMAVMLRTIGIPARWVKGFAPGTSVQTEGDGTEIIEVQNRDAHSWVEVYFPNYGWIPFEATATFSSPIRINHDLQNEQQQQNLPVPQLNDQDRDSVSNGRLEELEAMTDTAASGQSHSWPFIAIPLVAAIAGVILLWIKRRHLLVWWLRRQLSEYQEEQFTQKYQVLLKMLERIFYTRHEGETLREYVNRLSVSGEKRQDLWYLTQMYERVQYGTKQMEGKARAIANKILEQLSQQLKP
ncbi:DUF4129 domain-containing transglutaminase family protein [Brevibacillus fulvus]|uniref:DUF4129 domain-containing transglutaminase family protein n=1 Tax=Brevibacillus fulvus TaxID=1125967 RepID=UPI003B83450B